MPTKTTYELLSSILSGDGITPEQIRDLVRQRVSEDQYVEYKRGKFLAENTKKERAQTIRRMISGFANAEGGVLIIGVAGGENTTDGTKWEITGFDRACVGKDLREWLLNDVLRDLAAYLVPIPRVHFVDCGSQKEVVVIATSRAPNLVPCLEGGRIEYYLRIGSSTPAIPPYLHSDLVLGRRQRANLHVDGRFEFVRAGAPNNTFLLQFGFRVENHGISWCHAGAYEVVGYVSPRGLTQLQLGESVPIPIRQSIDVLAVTEDSYGVAPEHRPAVLACLVSARGNSGALGRIAPLSRLGPVGCRIPVLDQIDFIRWMGCLLVMPEGEPPLWVQLGVTIDRKREKLEDHIVRKLAPEERPVVYWGSLETWENLGAST